MANRIAVVGATGTIGREVLQELALRGIDPHNVVALASERSIGATLSYGEETDLTTQDLAHLRGSLVTGGGGDAPTLQTHQDLLATRPS